MEAQPLDGGLRNANFKLHLDCTAEAVVLRIYEHDGSLCRKEADLIRLVGRSVPVPEVIHVEPVGWEDAPPFALLRYVEGITFRELKRAGNADAIAQAAHSAGQVLAAIGRTGFPKAGWLGPGATVCAPLLEGAQAMPRFVDLCLESVNLRGRMGAGLCEGVHTLVWQWAPRLSLLEEEARLVHGDFGKRNLLVRNVARKWAVAAVLDWEFAVSGTTLADLGHFVCYERTSRPLVEPHFSQGYLEAGGTLPEDWRQVARIVDLASICESLTHEYLPDGAAVELIELVRATVENRDPQ
jgi:aminoglycoside phosphotransferase (APT) family kinase protein